MGRRGPPPKPSAIKKLQGTFRKHRAAKREPRPAAGVPACPRHLGVVARAAWKEWVPQLLDMGVLSPPDRKALELLCAAYAQWRKAAQVLEKDGPVTTGPKGDLRAHPAARVAADAWRRVVVGMREFGLTPSARVRIESDPLIPPVPSAPPATGGPPSRLPHDPNDPFARYVN